VEEARTYVQAQEVAHLDETSWRQGAKRAWLWGVRWSKGGNSRSDITIR